MINHTIEMACKTGRAWELCKAIKDNAMIWRTCSGFVQDIILADPNTDRITVQTFWQSHEDADRFVREGLNRCRAVLQDFMVDPPQLSTYLVAASTDRRIVSENGGPDETPVVQACRQPLGIAAQALKFPPAMVVSGLELMLRVSREAQNVFNHTVDGALVSSRGPATPSGGTVWHSDRPSSPPVTADILEWNSIEAVHHIQTGSITAEVYASHLLKRHRETRELNAFITLDESRVLESARAVDMARAKGHPLGPLAGLPLAIKDNIHTAGYPTTAGVSPLRNYYPQRNARVVDILLENGAIVLGKASLDELGREFTNSNEVYGFAKNPYNKAMVPGGGAGGTAVAISARVTPAGLGSDTAGSARIPASYCGIAGLRPSTSGRLRGWTTASWTVSSLEDGLVPISFAVSAPSPMGRTVSDVALLHSIVTGTAMPVAFPLRGVRIGVPRGFFWEDLEPEVARVSGEALEKLRDAGAILVEVDMLQWAQAAATTFFLVATLHGMKDLGDFLTRNGAPANIEQIIEGTKNKDVRARTANILKNPVTPAQAEEAVKMRIKLALEYEELLRSRQIAAVIYPTVPILPPLIRPQGDDITDTVDLNGKPVNQFVISLRNTCAASVIGVPALNVPAGFSANRLPVGISVSGLADGDSKLLGLSLSIEKALGRMPAPAACLDSNSSSAGPQLPINVQSTGVPPGPGPVDSVEKVLPMLKRSAYLNLHGTFDVQDEKQLSGTIIAKAPLRRYDINFQADGGGRGMCVGNLLGEECASARMRWTIKPHGPAPGSGGARTFMMDDLFVFDEQGQNQIHGSGTGRIAPAAGRSGVMEVNANGNIVEGTGIFAGVQGSYVLTGTYHRSRLHIHFTMRLMDPGSVYQTNSALKKPAKAQPADRAMTALPFIGEPDPEHPIKLTPTGATVHELLRAVHTDFDRGRLNTSLRSTITLGPIIARWRTDVIFNPADPSTPGTPDRPLPVQLENLKISFLDPAMGTLEARITDGYGFAMQFPGVSGPLFRMTGFGPLLSGSGRFRDAKGVLSMLGALDLSPSTFSNYYLLHVPDEDGLFRY